MAAMVAVDLPGVLTTDVELRSPAPSYTANTLERLIVDRQSALQFFFITGADAFAEIETWWRYPDVLDLCHFVVISRPDHPAGALPARLPKLAARMVAIDARPAQADALASPRILLLDLPTPDISSTRIRQRAARGEPLDGLVPPAVLSHILKHGLYRPGGAAAGLQG
jgi:nicotinate-nucleotide adenylyltransferase